MHFKVQWGIVNEEQAGSRRTFNETLRGDIVNVKTANSNDVDCIYQLSPSNPPSKERENPLGGERIHPLRTLYGESTGRLQPNN
jgi:hypothetical protein